MNQKYLQRIFLQAIDDGNIKRARDLVTHMDPCEAELRVAGYLRIVGRSLELGNLDAAQEAAPFCGYKFTEQDYEHCLHVSLQEGNFDLVFTCLDLLGFSITVSEIECLYRTGYNVALQPVHTDLKNVLHGIITLLLAKVPVENFFGKERLQLSFAKHLAKK